MKISHDGAHWSGTFHVTLMALLRDLFEDHQHGADRTELRLTVLDADGAELQVDVSMVGLTDRSILCEGQAPFPIDDSILAVEVL